MSVWMTEEVMRHGLRFLSRMSVWQQRRFLFLTKDAFFPSQHLSHIWYGRPNQTCPNGGLIRSVRFYSKDSNGSEDLEGMPHPSPLEETVFPTLIQTTSKLHPNMEWSKSEFRDRLQKCVSPSDVLDLTCHHHLTAHEINLSLGTMWTTVRKMSLKQSQCELQLMFDHPAFSRLLQQALSCVTKMNKHSLAYSFNSMVQLGVPQQSRVIQTFLRTCQEKLSLFDELCLSVVMSTLVHMEESPNVAVLKKGMRLAFKAHLPMINKVKSVYKAIPVLGEDCPPDLKEELVEKLLSMTDQISLHDCSKIMSSMASVKFHSAPLLSFCSQHIRENITGIPFKTLLSVLHSCEQLKHRDFNLFTDISDHVASMVHIWSNKQLIFILDIFKTLKFCPTALMEVFSVEVIAKPSTLTLESVLFTLNLYAYFNYELHERRQQFLDSLTQALDPYLPKMSQSELSVTVFALCVLGHFPVAPLEQLLQSSTTKKFRNEAPYMIKKQDRVFQMIDLCLRLDRPQLPKTLTVPAFLRKDPLPDNPSQSWLSQSLQTLLEDQEGTTLQKSVVVENYYFVDGVITKPVPSQPAMPEASIGPGEECSPAKSSQS
ncbi:FAST kinase domain-containing protein 2, mitochondrial isoform X2 [Antennarius striatus]|uniref:FAST kinase domain-containing protein 2, mitochondrial isoform X2 n=1 Tax=Antennarius striatus TaxID=241820 RepID=UPI0035AEB0B8